MVGQMKLITTVDKYITSGRFPRTVLLEGEWGCGKHTLVAEIGSRLKLEVIDISDTLNLETLHQITLSAIPHIYLIDCANISIKEQNVILKFLEEPLKNSYIILITESKHLLLNTVANRCVVWSFQPYTDDVLMTFIEDGSSLSSLKYANTPGRVLQFQQHPISEMCAFASKILVQIGVANYSNVLTIPNKINFKDKSELFDFDIFTYVLLNTASDLYKDGKIPYKVFWITNEFYNTSRDSRLNKVSLFEHYLIELKRVVEGGL